MKHTLALLRTFMSLFLLSFYIVSTTQAHHGSNPPRLTVVIVVDSMAYTYIQKLCPYFHDGLAMLLDHGVSYTHAYMPHGMPSTAPGHTALSTGTYAEEHGIICNSWYDRDGKKTEADGCDAKEYAVLAPGGVYAYGKAPCNLLTEGISDVFVSQSNACSRWHVMSISGKSRASILTANKLGKAIWFDAQAGLMTSSKYYFATLPCWLQDFNKRHNASQYIGKCWNLTYEEDSDAYQVIGTPDYSFTKRDIPSIGSPVKLCTNKDKDLFDIFQTTPYAHDLLIECAKAYLRTHKSCNKEDKILLWLCLSPLDKISHIFGPDSIEALDIIYHLDKQLKSFFKFVNHRFKESDVLYVLTADHGMEPIVEHMQKKGYPATRIATSESTKVIEDKIYAETGKRLPVILKAPHLYFTKDFDALALKDRTNVLRAAKKALLEMPGICQAWTYHELGHVQNDKTAIANYFRRQRYHGRSGDIIFQLKPYNQLMKYTGGTNHGSPYERNTHIPLVLYRHKHIEHKIINKKVYALQLANTLAQIFNIPQCASSQMPVLPGIFLDEDIFI